MLTFHFLVKFLMGGNIEDMVVCDVVPMDACHILLGRPWFYDNDMIQYARPNTYLFQRGNKNYTLHPLREEASNTPKETKIIGLLTTEKFEVVSKELGIMYALVAKILDDEQPLEIDDYLLEIQQRLWDFRELVSNDLPKDLPPMRCI